MYWNYVRVSHWGASGQPAPTLLSSNCSPCVSSHSAKTLVQTFCNLFIMQGENLRKEIYRWTLEITRITSTKNLKKLILLSHVQWENIYCRFVEWICKEKKISNFSFENSFWPTNFSRRQWLLRYLTEQKKPFHTHHGLFGET
jgi:hypothetical protein